MKRIVLLAVLVLVACSKQPPPPVVVVFAAGAPGGWLEEILDDYSNATGTPLDVRWGDSAELADALIRKSGDPADVLITDGVADIWRAGDRGALRPIVSAALELRASFLQDPDGYWAALSAHPVAIVQRIGTQPVTLSVDDLGTPGLAGRLCLSSSELAVNRSLIAFLVEARGVKETERLVRRWVRNLASQPLASESDVLVAVAAGDCDYGIASRRVELEGTLLFPVQPPLLTVTAIGIGRHAPNPQGGERLVDWVLRRNVVGDVENGEDLPVPAHMAGWHDEEGRRLAERAGYR